VEDAMQIVLVFLIQIVHLKNFVVLDFVLLIKKKGKIVVVELLFKNNVFLHLFVLIFLTLPIHLVFVDKHVVVYFLYVLKDLIVQLVKFVVKLVLVLLMLIVQNQKIIILLLIVLVKFIVQKVIVLNNVLTLVLK